MPNNPNAADNLKPFKKNDPRINRRGRPRDMGELRELLSQIAHEPHEGAVKAGKGWTRLEALLRDWMVSGDFRKQEYILSVIFGKLREESAVHLSSDKPIVFIGQVADATDDDTKK